MRIEQRRFGVPLPLLTGWTHPFAPLGSPLVDRAVGATVIDAWFDHVSGQSKLPRQMLLPFFPEDGPLAKALDESLLRRKGRTAAFGRHQRAALMPAAPSASVEDGAGTGRADYLDHGLGRKKLKELRRQARRLGDTGTLAISDAAAPADIAAGLIDFMALEAAGWKGRAGTAARDTPAVAAFLDTAVTRLAAEGKARIARLSLDGRAVAALIVLRSGATAWAWKIAYDETAARFSPGVQLLVSVTESLLHDDTVTGADSCAAPDHPMIDHIWRERLTLSDRLIDLGGGTGTRFALARLLETARRRAIGAAKSSRKWGREWGHKWGRARLRR
jgi:hypothetical protein